jgi:hypothetical protein
MLLLLYRLSKWPGLNLLMNITPYKKEFTPDSILMHVTGNLFSCICLRDMEAKGMWDTNIIAWRAINFYDSEYLCAVDTVRMQPTVTCCIDVRLLC